VFLVTDSFGLGGTVEVGLEVGLDVGVGVDAGVDAGPAVGVVAAAVGRWLAAADALTVADGAPGPLLGEQAAPPATTITVTSRRESCRTRQRGRGGSAGGCTR
jgi:hypothetical protein